MAPPVVLLPEAAEAKIGLLLPAVEALMADPPQVEEVNGDPPPVVEEVNGDPRQVVVGLADPPQEAEVNGAHLLDMANPCIHLEFPAARRIINKAPARRIPWPSFRSYWASSVCPCIFAVISVGLWALAQLSVESSP